MTSKNFGFRIKDKILFIDNYRKYSLLIIFTLFFLSCEKKNNFKEIVINENIINTLQRDNTISKNGAVYVISLFTDNGINTCEIVKRKESPTSINFVGCQIVESDTIFLYTDKKNKYLNCYKPSRKIIRLNKKQFTSEQRKEIKYYTLDTLNCSVKLLKE
ncbi:hypothetical protein EG347_05490 [Chryseobacterium sp. G0186]|uniref:hypothetical protein n=1 Tax=Chryseobacterium sp. G0186 TaxID=2487064 RepID=UPI000F510941|nr:hypothetical protein [Chryseobacterium sp. G0186]AZA77000.1 hypothetical protein EG347_05490 [Chryseobacterium sp. G0186]